MEPRAASCRRAKPSIDPEAWAWKIGARWMATCYFDKRLPRVTSMQREPRQLERPASALAVSRPLTNPLARERVPDEVERSRFEGRTPWRLHPIRQPRPGTSITPGHQCASVPGVGTASGIDPARPRARQAEAPRLVTIYSATRQALAMMVRVGLAPVAVGKGEPSTT